MGKNKRGICMADGGITETPEQLMARMAAKYGVSASSPPGQQPTPVATPIPKPATEPTNPGVGTGILNVLKGRHAQIDKAAGYANGGILENAADYWANSNAEFEKTNPNFGQRVLRGVNPITGFGSAVGAMKTAAGNGDVPGMAMAGISAVPAFGVLRAVPAAGAMKAAVAPSMGRSAAALSGGAVINATADDYQSGKGHNFKNGGIAGHVKFEGKGGPRDDQIPVKVAGQEINVSNKEQALIIPAKTAANAQAMEKIKQIIADSNDGRQPDMGNGAGPNFSDGGMTDEERAYRLQTGNIAGPDMRGMAARITSILPKESPIRQWAESGQQPASPAPVAPAAAPEVQAEKPAAFKAEPFGAKPEQFATLASTDGQFMTGKARYDESGLNRTGMETPDSSGGGFTQKGVSYNVNPSNQEGITKITSSNTNPLYTNIKPEEATAGLKNQMVGGDSASVQEGLDRHARANAITQSIIDKQPQGGIGILNDPNNVDAANAEKTARWRQDELLRAGKYGNRAAGEAIQANARLAGDQLHSATTQRGQDITGGITARGQDLAAQTAAKQLAVDSPLKDAQAQGILAQTDSARMLADIQKKALAGDAQAAASYRALTGKGGAPASDRYMTVQGGEEIGPDGMTKIKRPGGVFDAQTQKFVPMDGGQQQVKAPASALDYLKKNPNQSAAFKAKYGYLPEGF